MAVETRALDLLPLEDICRIFSDALKKNFKECEAKVVSCPDLTQTPWKAAARGLCGSPVIGETGGVDYMIPISKTDKIYDFQDVLKACNHPKGFILGAGAGPYPYVGVNSELIVNLSSGSDLINHSKVCTVDVTNDKCVFKHLPQKETRCSILCNFFSCQGSPGEVIYIKAKQRIGSMDLIGCLRKSLEDKFPNKVIGFGGIFRLIKGSVKIHVMPDFSKTPIIGEEGVNKWLHFYDMPAPMVFMSVAISKDPGLSFRLEHSHGHGSDYGGHYHYDTTPEEVEYEGYFNLAERVFRFDRP